MKLAKHLRKNYVGFLIAAALVSTALCAQTGPQEVLITKAGKRWHERVCAAIRGRETKKITQEQAVERGLERCKICVRRSRSDKDKDSK